LCFLLGLGRSAVSYSEHNCLTNMHRYSFGTDSRYQYYNIGKQDFSLRFQVCLWPLNISRKEIIVVLVWWLWWAMPACLPFACRLFHIAGGAEAQRKKDKRMWDTLDFSCQKWKKFSNTRGFNSIPLFHLLKLIYWGRLCIFCFVELLSFQSDFQLMISYSYRSNT
jgi:hypothetical protein